MPRYDDKGDVSRRKFLQYSLAFGAGAFLMGAYADTLTHKHNTSKEKPKEAIMKSALLLNGGKKFANSEGRLSATLQEVAKESLQSLGLKVLETHIDKGYDVKEEVQKLLDSDVWIYQMPGWWMGEPWIVKKYIDEVYIAGAGKFFSNDGRSSKEPTKNYGTGGLLQGKKYMFSLTWNAPLEAFTDKNEFFGGVGVDGVYLHLHKAHEFLGMQALPTFICNDVVKNPQVEKYKADYKTHLNKIFG